MGIGRRILDRVNSVMDRVQADDTPLSHVDPAELRAELQARIDARAESSKEPRENPRAKHAGASSSARAFREKAAKARENRVSRARAAREAKAKAFHDRVFREAEERARRSPSSSGSSAGASSAGASSSSSAGAAGRSRSTGQRRRTRSPFSSKNAKLGKYYKTLDLSEDASWVEIKKQYRKLMRKYHPDRHGGNPKKQKAATELTMRVTEAYHGLETHFHGAPKAR